MLRLAPGERVGGRYRLERALGRSETSSTWEAFDERLDRGVCVRIFDAHANRQALVERAGRAASLTHPRAVRVFDTGFEGDYFYTVCELLGGSIASQRLPLDGNAAVRVAIDVAEALAHAHEKGVVHGHISESNVLLSSAGAKLGDFAMADDHEHDTRDDLAALGVLLRRLVGAPTGPVPDRPRGFGPIVEALARGEYASADHLLEHLHSIATPEAVGRPHTVERRRWIIAIAVVLVTLAVLGVLRLGERSPRTRLLPEGRIEGTPLQIATIEDFDPPPGDGREGRATVRNIADGNPQTFWSTERYSEGPNFSGLKPGVGVIFDLGRTVEVGKAQLLFSAPGCSFEIRHTDDRGLGIDAWSVAAEVTQSPPAAPIEFPAASGRYWLLWITGLTSNVPGAGRAYACAVAEAELFAP